MDEGLKTLLSMKIQSKREQDVRCCFCNLVWRKRILLLFALVLLEDKIMGESANTRFFTYGRELLGKETKHPIQFYIAEITHVRICTFYEVWRKASINRLFFPLLYFTFPAIGVSSFNTNITLKKDMIMIGLWSNLQAADKGKILVTFYF